MRDFNVGENVLVKRNLKCGHIVGKVIQKDRIVYYVRIIDFITKKVEGDFVYTAKQLEIKINRI